MELRSKDGVLVVWHAADVDMVLGTVRLLVMVAESSGKHEARTIWQDRQVTGGQCPGTNVAR
jgi:hypothetical protein